MKLKQQESESSRPIHFMMAQLPFNREELVELNEPRADLMDDLSNLKLTYRNLAELEVREEILAETAVFLEIGCGRGYLLTDLYTRGRGLYLGLEPIPTQAKLAKQAMQDLRNSKNSKDNRAQLSSTLSSTQPHQHSGDGSLSQEQLRQLAHLDRLVPRGGKVPIWNKTLEKFQIKKNSVTHVYSYHVIEHLENPLLMLESAYQWLKPGGKLIITCPNVEGAMPSKHFTTWRCNIRAHRWLPGVTTLVRAVEAHGFTLSKVFTYGGHPKPRTLPQSVANLYYKWQNKGDVLCLMAQKI